MVKRTLRAAVSAGFLVGAAASASAQVLEIGADQSPPGLDPHLITAFASFMIVNGTIYEGLTAIDKDLKVVPGLAEILDRLAGRQDLYVQAPLGRQLPRRLRRWTPTTSHRPSGACSRKDIASPLASRLATVESATAVDPQTVELKLKEPSAPLLSSLSHHRDRADARSRPTRTRCRRRRSAPARSSSRNGSRTASCCLAQARRLLASRARRSSPA